MSQTSLRIIFAGTPDFAAFHLQQLLASQHQVIAVYTQPDRPAGRGKKLLPSPVKKLALEHQIPFFHPTWLKDPEAQQTLKDLDADVMVVVAYGLILPQAVLDAPRLGCINVHASLLPRWRGAAPIQRALAAGDRQTGVTIMQMDAGLDTGDMLSKVICDIKDTDTGGTLHDKLAEAGAPALLATLDDLAAGRAKPQRQNDQEACYADKISKEELLIDWTQPARALALRIRAFNPFPVAYTLLDGQRIKIWQADTASVPSGAPGAILRADKEGILVGCGEGALNLTQIQLPGGKPMDIAAVLNGHAALFSGDKQFQSNS